MRLVDEVIGGDRRFVFGRKSLGTLVARQDFGHDRALRFTFSEGGDAWYFDRATEVSPGGSIVEPSWAGWSSD